MRGAEQAAMCVYRELMEALKAQAEALESGDDGRLDQLRSEIDELSRRVDKMESSGSELTGPERSRRKELIEEILDQVARNQRLWEDRSASLRQEGQSQGAARRFFSVLGRSSAPASPRFQVEG